MNKHSLARLGGIMFVAAATLFGQSPAAAPATLAAKAAAPSKEGGKNLQVFKGLDHEGLDEAMDFISASLGVGCAQCHVKDEKAGWQFEKDDKEDKVTARKMILMTRAINTENFRGKAEVTCATCHGGQLKPASMPSLAVFGAPRPGSPATEKPKDLPALEAILEHYVTAIGGKAAVEAVASRTMKGSVDMGDGRVMQLEIRQKAPDRYLHTLATPRGVMIRGFDGHTGWSSRGGKAGPMEAKQLAEIRKEADLRFPAHIQQRFAKLTVLGRESVDGHEAYTVSAKGSDGSHEILSFDAATGLLARRLTFDTTILGRTSKETTYQDYRSVDGLKVPFKLITRSPRAAQVATFSEIKQGVPMEDAVFKMPASKP
jgi:hypothetical protein